MLYPGHRELPHAWAYLPDVGETVARLLEREPDLDHFARFHFAGHFITGDALLTAVRRAVGNPSLPLRSFPWWLSRLAAPFVVMLRELQEMRYLWREPLQLDNCKLAAELGGEPHTPLDDAVAATLRATGV